MAHWEFWIDVGGTFTDCLARSPEEQLIPLKLLSSGVTKGQVERRLREGRRQQESPLPLGEGAERSEAGEGLSAFLDSARIGEPGDFWTGYQIRFLDTRGEVLHESTVSRFDAEQGLLPLDNRLPQSIQPGTAYELFSDEEAPIVAIRYLLGLRLAEPIPPVTVKLGTTRGTNALVTRRGARTALVTTEGFADALLIGNQDRPRLFELAVQKPAPLFERVVEITGRMDHQGNELVAPDEEEIRKKLRNLKQAGIESIAICLLHSFANGKQEGLVEQIAREVGFREISTSSRLSPLIKIVSRGETTVVDAYLNPVLRDYVAGLRASLSPLPEGEGASGAGIPACHSLPDKNVWPIQAGEESSTINPQSSTRDSQLSILKIMTSAGGLVDAERFVGKDSILSGPAGGVVGFSRVAERAGFEKSIGFDMGGTSTDVSRYDGAYELEYETTKAGVRVVAPMLAIETVAAGGGSICDFDGVKLMVGPHSAGADPGPACYGRGGPLTVTDVNLYLGKLLPSHFPFPLDREAVDERLQSLRQQITRSPMGRDYSLLELAEGFLHIANANMVRAISNISVAKGYDPAEYVLVTFGGAGAQHACAMARSLGMTTILIHPYSGILSAYGIGLADVRRFGEQAVLKPYSAETLNELEPLFGRLEEETRRQVLAEDIPPEHVEPPVRSLEMRYQGVEASIHVTCPADGDYAARYEELHRQLYGYIHEGRPMEITAARVEVVGKIPDPPVKTATPQPRIPVPYETTRTCFDGTLQETGVYRREDLQAGDSITGPAILCQPTSTIVVDPGFHAEVTSQGEILIRETGGTRQKAGGRRQEAAIGEPEASASGASLSTQADPVMLEIFNNLFASIAEQMGLILQRTSFSTNVKERLDFSCAIFSPTGDLVVNAPHIPVHLGAMSETVTRILADNPQMKPGDVFITNDPYRGGSHLPDVTVITPVFQESGVQRAENGEDAELLFLTASRAHHAEIGGIVPGSMPPFSKNLAEEGVLIRNFQFLDGGRSREEELRQLLSSGPYPSRAVEDNLADIAAQVAANQGGAQQLRELIDRYTQPVVQAYMNHIKQAAAEKMRLALQRIPDGTYSLTDHLDDGSPIAVTISIDGNSATVDFTGTGPVTKTNLNANRAITTAAVLYVFRCLIAEEIPLNSGVLDPLHIVIPECLLNPPEHEDPVDCAAVVGGNVETSQRVVDTLLGALQVAAASQGTMNNLTFGDERFGYYETIGGGNGATPQADGANAVHTHMTNTRLTDAEVIERRYPLRLREFRIRRDSGGAGEHRGGDGIIRKLEFLRPLNVSMLSERRGPYPPFGLNGGGPGALGRNLLLRADHSQPEDLGGKFAVEVEPGDVLIVETPGGGGYGICDTG